MHAQSEFDREEDIYSSKENMGDNTASPNKDLNASQDTD